MFITLCIVNTSHCDQSRSAGRPVPAVHPRQETPVTERHARRGHHALRRATPWALLGAVGLACGLAIAPAGQSTRTTTDPSMPSASAGSSSAHARFDRYRGDTRKKALGRRRQQNGYNWSGYTAIGHSFTTSSADWTVPDISCSSRVDAVAEWVGLDGWGNDTVEQIGIQESCENGTPEFEDWYELYPNDPVYLRDRVQPGDHVHATARFLGGSSYELTLHDETQGWVQDKRFDGWSAPNESAEVIVEANRRAFPKFDRIDFTKVRFNGAGPGSVHAIGLWASTGGGRQQTDITPLYGSDLDSFSVTYVRE
ncbi:hypothetical protein CTZ27_37900 [Streptomyces griseocarneus]|nr:hypothetical protein CTZ27_37900 [Streptomyces griseocarneus]